MTIPAHIAAHLESARKMQATRPDIAKLYRELAEDEMDALSPQVRIPLGIDLAIDETCAVLFPAEKGKVN
jgi:hypothetical protein